MSSHLCYLECESKTLSKFEVYMRNKMICRVLTSKFAMIYMERFECCTHFERGYLKCEGDATLASSFYIQTFCKQGLFAIFKSLNALLAIQRIQFKFELQVCEFFSWCYHGRCCGMAYLEWLESMSAGGVRMRD